MLDRTHHFLSEKTRAEVETAAERFFPALGYRRHEGPGETAISYTRGRRFASFYSASLRACAATVAVEAAEGTAGSTAVHIRHRVSTHGRLVTAEDGDLLDAEARSFERFLERGDPDTHALLEAVSHRSLRGVAWKLAAVGLFGVVVFIAALLVLGRRR